MVCSPALPVVCLQCVGATPMQEHLSSSAWTGRPGGKLVVLQRSRSHHSQSGSRRGPGVHAGIIDRLNADLIHINGRTQKQNLSSPGVMGFHQQRWHTIHAKIAPRNQIF